MVARGVPATHPLPVIPRDSSLDLSVRQRCVYDGTRLSVVNIWDGGVVIHRRLNRVVLFGVIAIVILIAAVPVSRHLWAIWYFRAAEAALENRDFSMARAHLGKSLKIWPADADTLLTAAQIARRDGDLLGSGKLLDRAVEAGAILEAVSMERRMLRLQAGDLADADKLLGNAQASPDNPQSALLLEALIVGGLKGMNLELSRRALSLWQDRQTKVADKMQGLLWRGDLAIRQGDFDSALARYTEAHELVPDNDQARRQMAELLTRYSPKDALSHLQDLLKRHPDDLSLAYHAARCHRALGDLALAISRLEKILERSPDDLLALLEAGNVEMDRGNATAAERWLRRAEQIAPDKRDLNLALFRCLQLAGREAEAVLYQKRLATIDAQIEHRLRKGTKEDNQGPR